LRAALSDTTMTGQCRNARLDPRVPQIGVPWAREGSGFTLLFEALSMALCRDLPVAQAARLMRVAAKPFVDTY
jgi:hypothetical protein